jgi:hypothetical protein
VEVVESESLVAVDVPSSVSVGKSVGSVGVSAWVELRLVVVRRRVGRWAAGVRVDGVSLGLVPGTW